MKRRVVRILNRAEKKPNRKLEGVQKEIVRRMVGVLLRFKTGEKGILVIG